MGRTVTLMTLLALCLFAHSQDGANAAIGKLFLTDQSAKLTPTEITSKFKNAVEPWLRLDEGNAPTPFESSYNLNVFDYFELNDSFDSELKKEVYKQTTEYKTLLDSLRKIKSDFLNSTYYQFGFNAVGGDNFTGNTNCGKRINYSLQKKGFEIGIGTVIPFPSEHYFCPKVIEEVEFSQLPITKDYNRHFNNIDKTRYTQCLFIPMDATTALEIENNRSEIEILRVFNLKGIYKATFSDTDFLKQNFGEAWKVNVVKGGNMRLIIYNKNTDRIYFDKLYSRNQTK